MQNITNIFHISNDILKINISSYIECIFIDNCIYTIKGEQIFRLSQTKNRILLQTEKNKIIYENPNKNIICKEFLSNKNIDDFMFFSNFENKTKFIININEDGFSIILNKNYDFVFDISDNIEKIYIEKFVDLNFDKKFIKKIIDDILLKTHEYCKFNATHNIINLETEQRFNIKYEEVISFFNIEKIKLLCK